MYGVTQRSADTIVEILSDQLIAVGLDHYEIHLGGLPASGLSDIAPGANVLARERAPASDASLLEGVTRNGRKPRTGA